MDAVDIAWDIVGLAPLEKMVLLAIASYDDDCAEIEDICMLTGIDSPTVLHILRELLERGLIKPEPGAEIDGLPIYVHTLAADDGQEA
mgnify:CR=1 FL=1